MTGRIVFAVVFVVAGCLHLLVPQFYMRIMPPYLPYPLALVYVSGVCEVLCGLGVLSVATRHAAGWGTVALLVAVLPANIFMVTHPETFPTIPAWALWLRLPLQLPLIWWAWTFTRGPA